MSGEGWTPLTFAVPPDDAESPISTAVRMLTTPAAPAAVRNPIPSRAKDRTRATPPSPVPGNSLSHAGYVAVPRGT
jgi:hypothetical protein